jgi:transcriptional regulator with XRE-family HTH domain
MTVESLRERIAIRRELPPPEERRALRERAGLTLMEVGAACGVSFQTISHWELGIRSPRGRNLTRYVEALRVMREASG